MSLLDNTTVNRRSLLYTWGRLIAISGLAAVGSLTLKKNTVEDDCIIPALCEGCSIYNNCTLPKARSAQSVKKDSPHE